MLRPVLRTRAPDRVHERFDRDDPPWEPARDHHRRANSVTAELGTPARAARTRPERKPAAVEPQRDAAAHQRGYHRPGRRTDDVVDTARIPRVSDAIACSAATNQAPPRMPLAPSTRPTFWSLGAARIRRFTRHGHAYPDRSPTVVVEPPQPSRAPISDLPRPRSSRALARTTSSFLPTQLCASLS